MMVHVDSHIHTVRRYTSWTSCIIVCMVVPGKESGGLLAIIACCETIIQSWQGWLMYQTVYFMANTQSEQWLFIYW